MSGASQQQASNLIPFPQIEQTGEQSALSALIDELRGILAEARKSISYTEQQAAEKLGIEEITLVRIRRAGKISYSRVGRVFHYTEDHLRNYIVANEQLCAADRKTK